MTVLQTLHPTIETEEVDVEGSIQCGLRNPWLSGGDDELDITLAAGISQWMILHVTNKSTGEKRNFRMDMAKFIQEFVNSLPNEAECQSPQTS